MKIEKLESYNVPLDRPANNYIIRADNLTLSIDAGATKSSLKDFGKIDYILLTHGHWDHSYGIAGLKDKTICMGKETYAQIKKGGFKESLIRIADIFGYKKDALPSDIEEIVDKTSYYYDEIQQALDYNTILTINECPPIQGNIVNYIQCPGHSDDHLCYVIGNHLFPGDNILPGGGITLLDFIKYYESMMNLLSRIDWLYVHPGHGPDINRSEAVKWLSDIILGKQKKLIQLNSMIGYDWIPVTMLLPKLYPSLGGLLLFVATRSIMGYLGSLESMKFIEIDRNQYPWLVRRAY
ncbi:MAG: MBL fold metallo-hydrolase [Caldisphaera sp.]|nr:MBL fold metallo-hydrolase [Caldisphaera sp.]